MSCPSAIGARSTSIGAPAAMVEASGFIWETNGQSVAAPPTAAAAPVATKRKSRRVGWSAEDAVVTIPNPFSAAAGGTAPGNAYYGPGRLPAPATPAVAERPLFPANQAEQAVQNRSIGTLAGRAQARYRLICVQCTKSARSVDLFRHIMGTRRAVTNAGCAFPARHPAEHRDDSSSLCVPECGGPYYRRRWFSGVRPALPPGRHGLSRRGDHHASRLMVKIRAMA